MTSGPVPPAVGLVGHAREILAGTHPIPPAQATRAAAILTRLGFEDVMRAWCDRWGAPSSWHNMRSQLIALRCLADRTTADLAATAWAGLSNACHHHAYELAPTAGEIAHLVDQTEQLIARITQNGSRP